MKPAVWEFQNPDKQTSWFRGYVKTYQGSTVVRHVCDKVRENKSSAKKDALKLMKKLKSV
jgi:hypothetical protein